MSQRMQHLDFLKRRRKPKVKDSGGQKYLVRRIATGSSVGSAECVGLAALKPPTDFCRGGLVGRIARDRPDVWERMKQGEFLSMCQAAIAAGIVKVKEEGRDTESGAP